MLKRIYIDNFRCFVNFELSVDSINLFLGPNGAGKSTLFDVLRKIQAFIGGEQVHNLFDINDRTRWQSSSVQSFELEIEDQDGTYKYELGLEYVLTRMRVVYERLWFNNQPLLKLESGTIQVYHDGHVDNTGIILDAPISAIALISINDKHLAQFKKQIERFIIVQINPMAIAENSEKEETLLSPQMENFVSWYRHISQDQGKAIEITTALREVIDGFEHFRFIEAGQQNRFLELSFSGKNGDSAEYSFNELSDGQRVLIALYTMIHLVRSQDYILCIDEPENFVALPEIQPWLIQLYDLCDDGERQALLISHHPELIDYLASSAGYWFDRQSNRPVRVKRITENVEGGVPISELVARGWLHG